jgi:hypothetical protein
MKKYNYLHNILIRSTILITNAAFNNNINNKNLRNEHKVFHIN